MSLRLALMIVYLILVTNSKRYSCASTIYYLNNLWDANTFVFQRTTIGRSTSNVKVQPEISCLWWANKLELSPFIDRLGRPSRDRATELIQNGKQSDKAALPTSQFYTKDFVVLMNASNCKRSPDYKRKQWNYTFCCSLPENILSLTPTSNSLIQK